VDIGCGLGNFTKCVAGCGAKSVDAFDLSEEMVKAAMQTNAYHDVTVRIGNVRNMHNSFEVAFSFYITSSIQKTAFIDGCNLPFYSSSYCTLCDVPAVTVLDLILLQ